MTQNTVYRVTARYMSGSELVGYQLMDDNGNSLVVNKDKAILMISRGLIENMRVQYSGDEVIIRGKGVNLKTLPAFDVNKEQFRSGNMPQFGTGNNTDAKVLAQFKIVKRIMYKTTCVGYVIQDASGREANLNRNATIEAASKGLVINAESSSYIPNGSNTPVMVLRGVGCNIKTLPAIMVDQNGKVIDSSNTSQVVTVRATQSRRAGIIYKESTGGKVTFKPGDYIVCTNQGKLNVLKASEANGCMSLVNGPVNLTENLDGVTDYSVEFLGFSKQKITSQMVSKWPIVKIVNNKKTA